MKIQIKPCLIRLIRGDALSSLFFNFSVQYSIRKEQENQELLKLNGTHQLPIYASGLNLLAENKYDVKTQKLY
jgi:hypothetical protein